MAKLFVDNLTVIDFSYLHPERGLLGESWLLDVELGGTLDAQGMVLDFSEVKRQVKQMVDDEFDHKLLIPLRHDGTEMESDGTCCAVRYRCRTGRDIYHRGPASASCLLDTAEITPESVAAAIEMRLQPGLPKNVFQIKIRLHAEPCDGYFYHVSHGLKHHVGNCQRIAHGHRSCIKIFENGSRSPKSEAAWAARWCDIYIGTQADLLEERQRNGVAYYRFGYCSGQGGFELELPKACCYLIESDSTVENLAQHIVERLKSEKPLASFEVRAYEGVGKGAIAT